MSVYSGTIHMLQQFKKNIFETFDSLLKDMDKDIEKNAKDIKAIGEKITSDKLDVIKKIWSGVSTLSNGQKITPSVKLDQCRYGWLIVCQPYNDSLDKEKITNNEINYIFVPKTHQIDFTGCSIIYRLSKSDGKNIKYIDKLFFITNDAIKGEDFLSNEFVITNVYGI